MADGQIVFEVTADGSRAKADIKDITKTIQDESKKWDDAAEKSTNNISDSFSGMLKKIAAGFSAVKIGKALLDFSKDAIQAASALEEVQNVVDVTFGTSGARQIEAWAKQAGTQFGLTETQAKKFTSTLGAMMKSAGMSGDEIVTMSTDLAGLAADMASFYNLDFDTAFQKIRSGISGETEPLKQLGINMSTANLEAFALQQGLQKTWNEMTQGEQTMLRYQYLMSATADAQGDFARTSDGYANGLRSLETNIETLKTKLGEVLLPTVNDVINAINKLFPENDTRRTVYDDIKDIDLDTAAKIQEIEKTAAEAEVLITKLETIGGSNADESLQKLAEGANTLKASAPGTWKSLANALSNVNGLQNIFNGDTSVVEDLAAALSSTEIDTGKAEAWQTFLGALADNAGAVANLTGLSEGETAQWLKDLAIAANTLNPGDAEAWDTLLTTLVNGLSNGEGSGQFIEQLATQFLAMGTGSSEAMHGLSALGFSTDQIQDKQEEWLKTCKQLVNTIPELSGIINTETGAVEGGTGAISAYVDEWRKGQEKMLAWKAYYRQKDLLEQEKEKLFSKERDKETYKRLFIDEILGNDLFSEIARHNGWKKKLSYDMSDDELLSHVNDMALMGSTWANDYLMAVQELNASADAIAKSTEFIAAGEESLADTYGYLTEQEEEAAQAANEWSDATIKAATEAVPVAEEALKSLEEYINNVRDKVASSVNSVVSGFENLKRPSTEAAEKISALNDELHKTGKSKQEIEQIEKQIEELNRSMDKYKPEGMKSALDSQLAFMKEYTANLQKAQQMGLSNEFLAFLSDGSVDSAEYLMNLVENEQAAKEVDALYQEVQQKKKEFTDELTKQQLSADEVYQNMAEEAKKAVAALDLEAEAKDNAGKTVEGMAQGIAEHVPEVAAAVDAILAELNRLSEWGFAVDLGSASPMNAPSSTHTRGEVSYVASNEKGLDFVPFDGYLSVLHEGEGILTAEENRVWQAFKNGGGGTDYDTLGGVMRDNIKAGGNVYLDGRVVGSVISDQQGKSFRQLQRSGWQA